MKRKHLLLASVLSAAMILSAPAFANVDYSELDDMSLEDLESLQSEVSGRISALKTDAASESGLLRLETDGGIIQYAGFVMNTENFNSVGSTDFVEALVLKFDYTNKEDEEKMVQRDFEIKVYQNGAEINTPSGWTVTDTLPPEINNYYNNVLNGGTITIARAFIPEDDSPVTIIAKSIGADKESATMELDFRNTAEGDAPVPDAGENDASQDASKEDAVASESAAAEGDAAAEEAAADENTSPAPDPEEIEAQISQQPVRVLSTEVTDANDARFMTSLSNLGILLPHIINESDADIKNLTVNFVAWDKNNLPVIIKSSRYNVPAGYTPSILLPEVNLVPNSKLNEDDADDFFLCPFDETVSAAKAKAIVAEYVTYDGKSWTNPLLEDWKTVYGGQKLEEPVIYTDSETIQKVQTALNEAGYECGTPDGVAGSKTYEALNRYQQDNGLPVSNDITDKLLNAMGIQ